MSPEIAESNDYNQATDVFSFGIIVFEILSLNQPPLSDGQDAVNTSDIVICDQWPESIKKFLLKSWSSVISERPTMGAFFDVISDTISKLENETKSLVKSR
jgi:serine/threonine protein kinase